jgi:hypothetical protein
MTFHDLKLPKELSKKKKLELYKCWILDPLAKGDSPRQLELNWDFDRYGLSEHAAVTLALNECGEKLLKDPTKVFELLSQKCFVIFKVVLASGTMDEDVIILPENTSGINMVPDYDPVNGLLNVTVKNRIADLDLKNYNLTDISLFLDENTNFITIKDISLQEQIINKSVTGGK